MSFYVQVANTTTGPVTINVNSLGAKAVVFYGPLAGGALLAGNVYLMVYDSAGQFEVLSVPGQSNWVSNGMLALMPANTVKGNSTGSPATPQDISFAVITGGFRPGEYRTFASLAAVPSTCLVCDGTSYATATYPTLFSAIGYTYGGSGANFNVPNFSGPSAFMRAFNSMGPSAALGTLQADQIQGHLHGPIGGSTGFFGYPGGSPGVVQEGTGNPTQLQATTSGPITDGVNGAPRTGMETRPVNLAVVIAIQAM